MKKTLFEFVSKGTKKAIIFTVKAVFYTTVFYGGTSFFAGIYGWLTNATITELAVINKYCPFVLSILAILYLAESYNKKKWNKKYLTMLFCAWISMPILLNTIIKTAYFIHNTEMATKLYSMKFLSLKTFPIIFVIGLTAVMITISLQKIFNKWTWDYYKKEKNEIIDEIKKVKREIENIDKQSKKYLQLIDKFEHLLSEKREIELMIQKIS